MYLCIDKYLHTMKSFLQPGLLLALISTALILSLSSCSHTLPPSLTSVFPADGDTSVCPDTRLVLTFRQAPTLGQSGKIRVIDDLTGEPIDSLDLSIPAGPTQRATYGPECDYTPVPYDYSRAMMPTNRNTRPGTPSGVALPTSADYQLNIIGGFTDAFHFYPVIVRDTVATIYLHNNVLDYNRQYRVTIDAECFHCPTDSFSGLQWHFRTRPEAPLTARVLRVDPSGQADFCTVQGALDFVPDFSADDYYISIAPGDYEELVYARNKTHIHLQGSGMDVTRVHYANCEVFNPHPVNVKTNEWPGTFPSRRAAFMLDNCADVTLQDMTIATDMQGQAEGLLLNGERIQLRQIHIIGSGDALQANGTIYMEDCELDGGGDTFLGRGSLFAYRCRLRNDGGPFTWIRNTQGTHGDVFVECDFSTFNGRPVDLGRAPNNGKQSYPHAEQVLINCRVADCIPAGWSSIGCPTAYFAEFGTTDLATGQPADLSHRHPYAHQLRAGRDDKLIADYQDPAFVLRGWNPRHGL